MIREWPRLLLLRHLMMPAVAWLYHRLGSAAVMCGSMPGRWVRTMFMPGKGQQQRVVWIHAFRNALIPVVTNFGTSLLS